MPVFVVNTALAIMVNTALATANMVAASREWRPWMQDPSAPPAERAALLVAAMSTADKLALAHGASGKYVGNAYVANKTLGVPPLNMNDGPQGFRGKAGTSTSFPSGLTVAASWDRALARLWGATMGDEFARKGANVQLGPAMCVARVPRNGRNFEYISGEVSSPSPALRRATCADLPPRPALSATARTPFSAPKWWRRLSREFRRRAWSPTQSILR